MASVIKRAKTSMHAAIVRNRTIVLPSGNTVGTIAVEEVPTPIPGQGEVLVQIYTCGVCHSDVHAIDGDWHSLQAKLPLIPGHEGAGVVVALGSDVHDINVGDRVGIPWIHSTCLSCEYCNTGWETLCGKQTNTGFSVDGCLAEYAVAKATHAIKIPDGLAFAQASPLLCAGLTAYKGLKETDAKAGEFVAIVGAAGGLGHMAIQYANALGFRVVALDFGEDKLKYCKAMGAEFVLSAALPIAEIVEEVQAITRDGCHGVLCIAPSIAAYTTSLAVCRKRGCVVAIGLPGGAFPCQAVDVVLNRITIKGSIVGTRKDMEEAMDFACRGLIRCDSEFERLENIAAVVEKLRRGQIKGRVVMNLIEPECHPTVSLAPPLAGFAGITDKAAIGATAASKLSPKAASFRSDAQDSLTKSSSMMDTDRG